MFKHPKRTEMYYSQPVYRPPSEAYSLLVQATVGCSSAAAGRCHFCGGSSFHKTIPEKRFRIRPTEEIIEDIEIARRHQAKWVEKVFLLDSNALIINTPDLLEILKKCHDYRAWRQKTDETACNQHRKSCRRNESDILCRPYFDDRPRQSPG